MNIGLVLPGTVIVLKFLYRVTVDNRVTGVDWAKAILSFPIDIVFLSFSFGAIVLQIPPLKVSAQGGLTFGTVCAICAFVVVLLCKQSDRAFDSENNLFAVFFSTAGYLVSFFVLFAALNAGRLF